MSNPILLTMSISPHVKDLSCRPTHKGFMRSNAKKAKSIVFMCFMLPCNNVQSCVMNYHAKIFFSLTFESGAFSGSDIFKFAKLLCEQMYKLRYLLC